MNGADVIKKAIKLVETDADLANPCSKYCPWCVVAVALSDIVGSVVILGTSARDAVNAAVTTLGHSLLVSAYEDKEMSLIVLREALTIAEEADASAQM